MLVKAAAVGGAALCVKAQRVLVDFAKSQDTRLTAAGLTPTERVLAPFLKSPLREKEIADRTGLAAQTVHWHIKQICRKTCAHGREEAVRHLFGRGP